MASRKKATPEAKARDPSLLQSRALNLRSISTPDVASVPGGLVIPRRRPVISAERFGELKREGRIAAVNPMSPGEIAEVRYPSGGKLLVHRLGGFDLSRARRVDVTLFDREGEAPARFDDVPYDAARREVLVACQSHFVELFPQDAVFRVEAVIGDKREEASYTVLHRL